MADQKVERWAELKAELKEPQSVDNLVDYLAGMTAEPSVGTTVGW